MERGSRLGIVRQWTGLRGTPPESVNKCDGKYPLVNNHMKKRKLQLIFNSSETADNCDFDFSTAHSFCLITDVHIRYCELKKPFFVTIITVTSQALHG